MTHRCLCSLLAAAVLLPPLAAAAADSPSVLVRTVAPRWGAFPDRVTAYGTAAPALDGSMTLSIGREGRVLDLAVTPGESVRAGDRLVDFAPSAQAISTFQQAQSALELARRTQAHTKELLAQQLATRDQLAQADKAAIDAEAALEALEQEGGGRKVVTIKAPFDGTVGTIPVARGDQTAPGAPLVTLMRADGLVVTVGIEPADRSKLRKGDGVRLEPLTESGQPAEAAVVRVDGALNAKTRLIDADVSAPPGAFPGEAFRAVITVGSVDGWLVPKTAVLIDEKGPYLFQVADGKAIRIAVTVLGTDDRTMALAGSIEPSRPLVVEGNYQLSDGMAVRREEPAS